MNKLHPRDLKIGSKFYECQHGINIEATVTTEPVQTGTAWTWNAVDDAEKVIQYLYDEAYSHYAPRLYTSPQYFTVDSNAQMFIFYSSSGKVIQSEPFKGDK